MSEPGNLAKKQPKKVPLGKKILSPIQVIEEEDIQSQKSEDEKEEPLEMTEEDNSNPILLQCLKHLAYFSKKHEIQDNDNKLQTLIDLKGRMKLLLEDNRELIKYIQRDEIVLNMRDLLIDRDMSIRQNCVRFFKILMDQRCVAMFRRHKIHVLICRNLERNYGHSTTNNYLNEALDCKI